MKCSKCSTEQDPSAFYIEQGRVKQPCKGCKRRSSSARYQTKKPEILARYHSDAYLLDQRTRRSLRRLQVLTHYSQNPPSCACCQDDHLEFLTLDHVNGGGTKHRKRITSNTASSGGTIYGWVVDHSYPEGFQVLCHNCNFAKHLHGECPYHKKTGAP